MSTLKDRLKQTAMETGKTAWEIIQDATAAVVEGNREYKNARNQADKYLKSQKDAETNFREYMEDLQARGAKFTPVNDMAVRSYGTYVEMIGPKRGSRGKVIGTRGVLIETLTGKVQEYEF